MSLDVYLYEAQETIEECECPKCWTSHKHVYKRELYSRNITHNLGKMADAAGIYYSLWRPDEMTPPAKLAKDITALLEQGLAKLEAEPDKFKAFNATNGWGTYDCLVEFTRDYLRACREYPEAEINVSR